MSRISLAMLVLFAGCHNHHRRILASGEVGAEGGRIEGPGVALEIPAGALPEGVAISIEQVEPEDSPIEDAIAPGIHLEPEGLTFAKPVRLELELPGLASGVILWTSDDGGEDEIGGYVANGFAIAENTHFSDIAPADTCPADSCDGCEVPEDGEPACEVCPPNATCKPRTRKDACRSKCLCGAVAEEPVLGTKLCWADARVLDPLAYGSACPPNPEVPPPNDGHFMLGARDLDLCNGWLWEPTEIHRCSCETPGENPRSLCPLPWTKPNGSWGCNSTLQWGDAIGQPEPAPPLPFEERIGPLSDAKYDNAGVLSYVQEGSSDGTCKGYENLPSADGETQTNEALLDGALKCAPEVSKVDWHWQPYVGVTEACEPIEWPEGQSIPPIDPITKLRCRLSQSEYDRLNQARGSCGMPPIGDANTFALLTFAKDWADGEAPRFTYAGISSDARASSVPGEHCPEITEVPPYVVMPLRQRKDGELYSITFAHAEGHALGQLAKSRGREPNPGDGTPQSNFGAVGGETGGCADMSSDRAACAHTCNNGGIDDARQVAGLDVLFLHSPAGCTCFAPGYQNWGGGICDLETTCQKWTGPESTADLCKRRPGK